MKLLGIVWCLCISCFLLAQPTDKKLLQKIEPLLQQHAGVAGVYIQNLTTGKVVAINADTLFPTASMVKLPILLGVLRKMQQGQLTYHQNLTYTKSLFYSGDDITGSLQDSSSIELSKLILLMLSVSDNTASLWLQKLADADAINQWLTQQGFVQTKINSRVAGREAARATYGWGQTTPKEMALLLLQTVDGTLLPDSLTTLATRVLGRNYWDEQAISALPPNVFVASKNGCVNASRSEVLYVQAPKQPFVICICTKQNADTSWGNNNQAWQLAIEITKRVYNHYN
jgi:beta-lactamase class A